jgi:16S rRNA (guanine527-N7)-methyltransferase
MDTTRIAELLEPFLAMPIPPENCHSGQGEEAAALRQAFLSEDQLHNISIYIDLLLRWNARINLTAIRQPEHIVTRHFGESLFAARHLFPRAARARSPAGASPAHPDALAPALRVIDVGSGAGFPGLPIKIWAPDIALTLIESTQKKATFLRELSRKVTLTNINVFSGRAEDYPKPGAEVVTLRAVERFDIAIPIAASLVAPAGRLALLVGEAQVARTLDLTPEFAWRPAVNLPLSTSRRLMIGVRESSNRQA